MHTFKPLLLFAVLLGVTSPVFAINLPPTFAPIAAQTVSETGTLNLAISATDPEGSPVTLSAKNLKSWMTLTGNTFTAKPGLSDSGTYTVSISASDGAVSSSSSFTLTVTNLNQAPTITPVPNKSMSEGGTLSFRVTAADADRDVVTITASPLKPWMTFDGKTLTATPGYSDSGSYVISFTASDGIASTLTQTTLTVSQVNQAPVFTTASTKTMDEGQTLSLTIAASDPDGDVVTTTAMGLKPWMSFSNSVLVATPGFSDAGSYPITLTASDGQKQTNLVLTLTVSNINRAPTLSLNGPWTVGQGKVISLPISASDPDGDATTLTASDLAAWMSFDGKTFRARPSIGTAGSYTIRFTASDASTSSSGAMTLIVAQNGDSVPQPWTAYMGSQAYGASWSGWQRAWLSGVTGLSLVNDPTLVDALSADLASRLLTHDVMIPIYGFDGGGATGESLLSLMDLIHDGGVVAWKQAVKDEIAAAAASDPTGLRVSYQLGNEISRKTLDEHLRSWTASRGITLPGVAKDYDPEFISYYVEYYVAPSVEAALEASLDLYGNSETVLIALGSIGNGGSSDARAWLDLILDYTVQGTYAPTLAGKKVSELIDIITVHYVGPNANLASIWDKWAGVGRLAALWSTEEIGGVSKIGLGAGKAVSVTGNYLSWFYQRSMTPAQGRVSYYAWEVGGSVVGTAADESMTTFLTFLGSTPLEVFTDGVTAEGAASGTTYYRFHSLDDESRRVVSIVPSPTSTFSVQYITVSKEGWAGTIEATAHRFSASGHSTYTGTVTDTGTEFRISLPSPATLSGGGDALMVTLLKK